jgi:hypothetical protein
LPSLFGCLFRVEVSLAMTLFLGSMFLAITVSASDFDETTSRHHNNKDAEERKQTITKFVASVVVILSLLFILFDLIFSCVSTMAMRSGISKIKEIMVGGGGSAVSKTLSQSNGLLHWESSLDRAIFFARINVILVCLSVTTTTVFYLAFTIFTFAWVVDTNGADVERRYAFLFVAWLFDSIFNDVCVIFVGFGPTSNALATVGEAATADIIGVPMEDVAHIPEGRFFVGTTMHGNIAVGTLSAQEMEAAPSKNACD